MKKLMIAFIATSLIVSATTVLGAEQKGPFSISPVAGGYTYEGTQHIKTGPVYGGRLGYDLTQGINIEALFDYSRTEGTKSKETATMYRFGADLLCNLLPDNRFMPYLALGITGINIDAAGHDKGIRAAWSYGAGIKYFLTDNFALRGDVRHIIFNHDFTTFNNLEYILGVHIPFGGSKPTTKSAAAVRSPSDAAPADAVKPVLTQTTVAKKFVVPAINNPSDSDGDGIRDSLDRCPDTAPGTAVDNNGCPKLDVPAQKAETAKRFCDKPVVLTVSFDSGKADIKAEYHDELTRVATFLKEFPGSKGTIEGHTDNVGNNAANIRLSQRRADNVRAYLINKFGIDPDRIAAKGFGPTKPVASNKTSFDKAKNRRIETVFSCE